jgi:hypothetical protein
VVRLLLRLEGLAVFAVAAYGYGATGAGWGWFALLFLAPDLALAGYLAGPRVGSLTYNLVHTYALAAALLGAGWLGRVPLLVAAGCLLAAHIGADRALGFGLKYPAAFRDTHIQRV